MTSLKYILLAVSGCTSISSAAFNYDLELDGIYYTINASNRTATIVSYPDAEGNVAIPDKITYNTQELTVDGIGDGVFEGNEKIVSVSCNEPKSVGKATFKDCINLVSIQMPCKFERTIPESAFSGCSNLAQIASIDGTFSSISDEAFMNCKSIRRFTIPKQVSFIGARALYGFNPEYLTIENDRYYDNSLGILTNNNVYSVLLQADTIYWQRKTFTFHGVGTATAKVLILAETARTITEPISVTQKVITLSPKPVQMNISFTTATYMNTPLYVPKGSLEKYKNETGWWSSFFVMKEEDDDDDSASGIKQVSEKPVNPSVYNIKGEKLNAPHKGLNIIKCPDGTMRKVVVRNDK